MRNEVLKERILTSFSERERETFERERERVRETFERGREESE